MTVLVKSSVSMWLSEVDVPSLGIFFYCCLDLLALSVTDLSGVDLAVIDRIKLMVVCMSRVQVLFLHWSQREDLFEWNWHPASTPQRDWGVVNLVERLHRGGWTGKNRNYLRSVRVPFPFRASSRNAINLWDSSLFVGRFTFLSALGGSRSFDKG